MRDKRDNLTRRPIAAAPAGRILAGGGQGGHGQTIRGGDVVLPTCAAFTRAHSDSFAARRSSSPAND